MSRTKTKVRSLIGGRYPTLIWVWKTETCSDAETRQANVITRINRVVPSFMTHHYAEDIESKLALLCDSKAAGRFIRKEIMGDQRRAHDAVTGAVDARMIDYITSGDANLIVDLRALNGSSAAFDDFFDTLDAVLRDVNLQCDKEVGNMFLKPFFARL